MVLPIFFASRLGAALAFLAIGISRRMFAIPVNDFGPRPSPQHDASTAMGNARRMKTLYLVRHAKSSWAVPGQRDFERALNERGLHDAPEMAVRLQQAGARIDVIVSSPAERALKTASLFCETWGVDPATIVQDRQIYLAGSPKLLQIISFLDEGFESAMLVAHNPALTDLANDLAHAGIDNIPTCGIVTIALPVEHWAEVLPGIGKVVSFDFPKNPE